MRAILVCGICAAIIACGRLPQLSASEPEVRIGDVVADLSFKDIRSLKRTLNELGDRKAYVLVFATTHCPIVQRTIPKLKELDARFGPLGVQFVAVNVGADDSIRDMAAHALDLGVTFPFVKDADYSCAAKLGVTRTPQVAVLDSQRKLVYRGRVDDQYRLGGTRPEPSRRDLEIALQEVLDGKTVSVPETAVDGCLISRPPDSGDLGKNLTYYQDVAPIFDRRCNSCHRTGTAAPFELTSFESAAANAEMIAEVVVDERMPPWFAHPRHGVFQNDPSLTADEQNTIVQWVRNGRAAGTPPSARAEAEPAADVPSADPQSPAEWRIGKPDLIVSMVADEIIPETGFVPYRYSVLPYVFLDETWIEAFEIRPDNPAVVHHCNMAYVTSSGAGEETFITGHVPGGQPMDLGRFDNGVAYRIPKLAGLGLQIHFTTTGKPERCRISVGMRYPRNKVQKQLTHFLLDPRPLRIPPNNPAHQVRSHRTLSDNIDLLGMFTHMHVRGRDMTFFAEHPDGQRETLLQIPNYNFEWQLGYELKPGQKKLAAGTKIEAIAHFDNSPFNPYNPDPNRMVTYGPQTVDEMFNGFVFFVKSDEQLDLRVDPKSGRAIR